MVEEIAIVKCRGAYPETPLPEPVEVTVSSSSNPLRRERRVGCPYAFPVPISPGGMVYVRCMAQSAEIYSKEMFKQANNMRTCHHKHTD